jgi:hypothetical protein
MKKPFVALHPDLHPQHYYCPFLIFLNLQLKRAKVLEELVHHFQTFAK